MLIFVIYPELISLCVLVQINQQSKPGEVTNAVKVGLQAGYRHLDLAWIYGNSAEVGQGIKDSGVARSEIFLTDKLWCTKHSDPSAAVDETLKLLDVDALSLYLVHWPVCLNANGNDPKFPKLEDGSRDLVSISVFLSPKSNSRR